MDKSIVTLVSDVQIERTREAHMFHELANVSTLGFKRAFEQFSADGTGTDTALSPTLVEMKEGPKIYTGNPLDLYLNNDAVMGVINDEGQVNFTRRGDLKVNAENQLVLGSGKLVASISCFISKFISNSLSCLIRIKTPLLCEVKFLCLNRIIRRSG